MHENFFFPKDWTRCSLWTHTTSNCKLLREQHESPLCLKSLPSGYIVATRLVPIELHSILKYTFWPKDRVTRGWYNNSDRLPRDRMWTLAAPISLFASTLSWVITFQLSYLQNHFFWIDGISRLNRLRLSSLNWVLPQLEWVIKLFSFSSFFLFFLVGISWNFLILAKKFMTFVRGDRKSVV